MRRDRDGVGESLVVAAALALAGFASMTLAWRGTADKVKVPDQLPYLLSGALGGLALIGVAAVLATIQQRRWVEAHRQARFEAVVAAAADLLAVVRPETEEPS